MGTPLSNAEWADALNKYPRLAGFRDQCLKTGEATKDYNCIAWSVGVIDDWYQPAATIPLFKQFFIGLGYVECGEGEATIDAYADGEKPTHASRNIDGVWSSKRGPNIRMTHPRYGLTGTGYGEVVAHFKRNANAASSTVTTTVVATTTTATMPNPDDTAAVQQVSGLVEETKQQFPLIVDNFEQNWEAWKASFKSKLNTEDNSGLQFAQGPEWQALLGMGSNILPQIVNKLKTRDNIFGCFLYNKLQTDTRKKVSPTDVLVYNRLSVQAREIIKLYGAQVTEFNQLAADWAAAQDQSSESSSAYDFISGPAFNALRDMGSPAVPLIMNRYANDQTGWWSELLHQIINDVPSDAQSFHRAALYRQWSDWFQGRSADQAA